MLESASLVSGDDAGRRVVMLVNDGRKELSAAVGLLYTGLQIMNPGESMTAHRHAASACGSSSKVKERGRSSTATGSRPERGIS